jgi:hypothetical protein
LAKLLLFFGELEFQVFSPNFVFKNVVIAAVAISVSAGAAPIRRLC